MINVGTALDANDRVIVDESLRTSTQSLFAAGDITPGCQDVLAAAAEGAKAAKQICKLLAA